MKILVTGSTGYIGKRLLPELINNGHEIICCVRDKNRFTPPKSLVQHLQIIEVDFLDKASLQKIPHDIDAAYYLIHSMATSSDDFETLEEQCAQNFKSLVANTSCNQVIYLSGITNEEILSKHLQSRKNVEEALASKKYALTTFKAGIIVGSGSSSFEIIRDLVEKLPFISPGES